MQRRTMVILLVVLVLPVVAAAQSVPGFRMGNVELTLSGSGQSDHSFDATGISSQGSLGLFLTDSIEVLVRQGFAFTDSSTGRYWNGSTRVALDLHLDLGMLQPYVGANIGFIYGDKVKDQFIAGPEGGLKLFVKDSTFLYGGLEYQILFEDSDGFGDNYEDGVFVYTIGIGVVW